MLYEGYTIYGPYQSSKDKRWRITLKKGKEQKLISYPKYLMELHLGRYLQSNEEVHHIDENPENNNISNLEVINGTLHRRLHNILPKMSLAFTCIWCKKEFILSGNRLKDHWHNRKRGTTGPFCSKRCAGKWSTIDR